MKTIRLIITMLLAVSILVLMAGNGLSQDFHVKQGIPHNGGTEMMPGEILVKFTPGTSHKSVEDFNRLHGVREISTSRFAGFKRLKIPAHKTVADMVAIYSHNPNVEYAEPNFLAHALWTPNDTYYAPYQWDLDNPVYGGIHMESAWDVTTGAPNVIVAVIDTGIAYEDYQEYVALNKHRGVWKTYQKAPDLAGTNFVAGYDFINNDNHPNDDEGHGTHVSGTIAQSTNNALGVAGIAFNTTLMPVKALDSSGSGSYSAIADAIYYAADNGARVINMSLGGSSSSITLENALAYAFAKGVTIVCASGNNGSATTISYPAAYDAYCIAVGATRYDETLAGYSNRGASLDIVAPGGDTSVDQNGDGYGDGILQQTFGTSPTDFGYYFYQGTSMATPHVTGVAALLLAQDPTRTPADVREILQASAEDKGSTGWDPDYGWGLLDASAALGYAAVPNQQPIAIIASPGDQATGTEDIAINFDATGSFDPDGDSLTYIWDFGDGSSPGSGIQTSHAYSAGGQYYNAALLVNDGKTDSAPAKVKIWIIEINDPPVADAGPDQDAILNQTVNFDASGSYDIDDGIASYQWDFGDGKTATGVVATHSYAAVGSYTVKLTVTDVGGLSASDEAIVNVTAAPVLGSLSTSLDLALSERSAGKNHFVKAVATVTVLDGSAPVEGVTVNGSWSGVASLTASAVTNTAGQAVLESEEIKNPAAGSVFTLTVTSVQKTGYASEPSGTSSGSISY